tara:strand:+ start:1144 stop:1605 length:462 start_codon:yes stop_codon:yes gene_type:complete
LKLKKYLIVLGFILLNITSGCTENPETVGIDCSKNIISDLSMSDLVLVGTDVVDIESFNKSNEPLSKNYSAETGGAALELSLDLTPKYLTIIRSFKEPGQAVNTKTYIICNSEEGLSSDELNIRVVNDGVLMLETDPGVYRIPSDLWILYDKK